MIIRSVVHILLALALSVPVFFSSGCVQPGGYPEEDPTSDFDDIDCLAPGSNCGGGKLCCPGTICKGGRCSKDPTCVGSGGHCNNSGDCCGLATCRNGVCDAGGCRGIGGHCEGSADCCGALVCREGVCR